MVMPQGNDSQKNQEEVKKEVVKQSAKIEKELSRMEVQLANFEKESINHLNALE